MDIINLSCLHFAVLSLVLFLSSHTPVADTLSANASLSAHRTIVSAAGIFALGFFKPGKALNFYLGIWYNKLPIQTVVWVANRDRPISNVSSAHLKIRNGSLVLFNGSRSPVWSSSDSTKTSPSRSEVMEAVLLDSGNFVLRRLSNASGEGAVWQSFDYPTDTWLPGGKLARNKRTGANQRLTSWKNPENPAPGPFSLELDPAGTSLFFVLWNGSTRYWASGIWNPKADFASLTIPQMRFNVIFSYVSNENESYYTYSMNDSSILSRLVMDVSGKAKVETWLDNSLRWNLSWAQLRTQSDVYAFCGAYGISEPNNLPFCDCLPGFRPRSQSDWDLSDYAGGCLRNAPLNCGRNGTANGDEDKFQLHPSMKLPETPQDVASGSAAECESACLNNCACTAYAYDSSGCSIWTGSLINLQQLQPSDSSGKSLYLRLAASEFPEKSNKGTVIGIAAGSAAVVFILLGLFLFLFLRWRRNSAVLAKVSEGSLVAFGYRELQVATKFFSQKLGGGGFGSVFKGTLVDSTVIAVKKLESINQGEKQFRTEVSTIGTIQHLNLSRLRGFCSEGAKKLLVYDYMENGSLHEHLFGEKYSKVLNWKTRYQIALGIARGLVYLHEKCRYCIIHLDIKPENILLDSDFCPKVADFGLAKLVGRDFSRVLTTMRGTRGYLAPEWISGMAITTKADVYSYGMMLFEIISGARNFDPPKDDKHEFFPNKVASMLIKGGDIFDLLDARLNEDEELARELARVCKVACWCIQYEEGLRPNNGSSGSDFGGGEGCESGPNPTPSKVCGRPRGRDLLHQFMGMSNLSNSRHPFDFFILDPDI